MYTQATKKAKSMAQPAMRNCYYRMEVLQHDTVAELYDWFPNAYMYYICVSTQTLGAVIKDTWYCCNYHRTGMRKKKM